MNSMNPDYFRVIPRDLFNEGKLLTELGFLSLAIHDNKDGIANILEIELIEEEHGFIIVLDESEGSLSVINLLCQTIKYSTVCQLYTPLNCRNKNALRFNYAPLDLEGEVFDNEDFSSKFKSLLEQLA
jgi:hypothetical protein